MLCAERVSNEKKIIFSKGSLMFSLFVSRTFFHLYVYLEYLILLILLLISFSYCIYFCLLLFFLLFFRVFARLFKTVCNIYIKSYECGILQNYFGKTAHNASHLFQLKKSRAFINLYLKWGCLSNQKPTVPEV